MSTAALRALSCSFGTSRIEVFEGKQLGLELLGPVRQILLGCGGREKLCCDPGEHGTANGGDGGSFRERLHGEGSRVQRPGILQTLCCSRCQAAGERHSCLSTHTHRSFHYLVLHSENNFTSSF